VPGTPGWCDVETKQDERQEKKIDERPKVTFVFFLHLRQKSAELERKRKLRGRRFWSRFIHV
jgi:hypothetical protein